MNVEVPLYRGVRARARARTAGTFLPRFNAPISRELTNFSTNCLGVFSPVSFLDCFHSRIRSRDIEIFRSESIRNVAELCVRMSNSVYFIDTLCEMYQLHGLNIVDYIFIIYYIIYYIYYKYHIYIYNIRYTLR
jgi:hypothetical protein